MWSTDGAASFVEIGGGRTEADLGQAGLGLPYDHGRSILTAGSGLFRVPLVGAGTREKNPYNFDNVGFPFAVSDNGESAVFLPSESDRSWGLRLVNLDTGAAGGLPTSDLDRCVLGQADVSPDGSEAVAACVPCGCAEDISTCAFDLCVVKVGADPTNVRPEPANARDPRYTPDGRISFFTDARSRKENPGCKEDPNGCRYDLVSVPMHKPDAAFELHREGAGHVAWSRVSGRMLYSLDGDGNEGWLAVADRDGGNEKKLEKVAMPVLPRLAFSLDDAWIAYTSLTPAGAPSGRACNIERASCVDLGPGFVAGWVRPKKPEQAAAQDRPDALTGCWRVDHSALTNAVPAQRLTPQMREHFEGYRFRLSESELIAWADTKGKGRAFVARFSTKMNFHPPDKLFLDYDTWHEPKQDIKAAPQGPVPSLPWQERRWSLRLSSNGELRASWNPITQSLWDENFGPLVLQKLPCPDDAPAAGGQAPTDPSP